MAPSTKTLAGVLMSLATLTLAASAQQLPSRAHPTVRIVDKVDTHVVTRLSGTHPQAATSGKIGARVAGSKQLQHLHLMLTSSADQEAALQELMGQQQDKTSPNYHKWLTPQTFGAAFGPAQADINQVTAWLADQGLTVESVSNSHRVITFSGSVAQVEAAFQTQINNVTVDGEAHVSNTTDISVPAALSTVIGGVARLNDFFPRHVGSMAHATTVQADRAEQDKLPTPLYGTSTGTHYVSPGDAAIIYNTTPLVSAGIDGTGQTVAIMAQSNIDLADVQKFRSMFGLPKNDPTIINVDQDPGLNPDDGEAYLDAEWGGALAPNAAVKFIVSSPNYFSGGVDAAALYSVENNIGDIISLSYGGCEYNNGQTYSNYWNSVWEQAAAQGQTVLVSSGDSGAAGCTSSSNSYASQSANGTQYSVNSLGSSAYNVAMGGSIFVDFGQTPYWGTTGTVIPFINALSYIPEAPVNQSRLATTELNAGSTAYVTGSGVFAGGGGVSIYTARPSWQTGSGIPTNADAINTYMGGTGIATGYTSDGTHRLVPDLVNIAANGHDATLYCASSLCSTSSTGALNNAGLVGGTSVATPVQAGIQALINQKNGGRQGNILPILYKLANIDYLAGNCQAQLGAAGAPPTLPAATCNFHDVVTGSITVPASASGTAGIGFLAGVGFDEASGLGSMNVTNVANNYATVGLATTTTTFTLSPTIGITHGASQNLSVTVAAATGTPTGDVTLVAETASPNGPRDYKLTAGTYTGLVGTTIASDGYGDTLATALPAGNYNVHVHYAGDTTFAASDSASIPVSIGKEASTVNNALYSVDPGTLAATPSTTFTYGGGAVYLSTQVTGSSTTGVPTGTLTYTLSGSATGTVSTKLDGSGLTYFYSGFAYPAYYLKPNFAALPAGTYTIATAYPGDTTFNASNFSNSFTVARATPVVTFSGPTNANPNTSTTFSYAVALAGLSTTAPNSTVYATGSVNFVDSTTASVIGTCTLANGTCSVTTASLATSGANTITANYAGDTNYAASTNTLTTTIGALTAPTVALTISGTATVGYQDTLKATLNPTTATGTVAFYDGTAYLGTATLTNGVGSLALGAPPTTGLATGGTLTAGTHSFSAVYSGSTTYSGATGTLSTTIAQSTTTITLSGPANSTYGQPVTASVYISRSSNSYAAPTIPLTGTFSVTDSVSGTVVATGTPLYDVGGYHYYVSAATVSTLAAGTHTLTATYSGDANFAASTSTLNVAITVAKLTPVVMLSSPSVIYGSGATVTLTASIPVAAALAAPAGGLVFYDGANQLGTGTLTYNAAAGAYTATYSTTTLTRGPHVLSAVLGTDTNYNTASGTLNVTINTNNVWIANGNGTTSALSNTGTAVTPSGVTGGGTAVAIDNSGNVWALSKTGNNVTKLSNAGAPIATYAGSGNIVAPSALAIDGAGIVWIANGGTTLTGVTPAGATISANPYSTGFSTPASINVDASGNLWVTNQGDNSVTEVIGIATPIMTPQTNAVKNATPAQKP